jgi:hypothetical protein
MVHCHAKTAEKKRCTNESLFGELYCGIHIKEKSAIGQRRKLTASRCDSVKYTRRSPFSHRKYAPKSKARKLVLRTCDNHALLKMLKADENKLHTLKRKRVSTAADKEPKVKKAKLAVAKVEKEIKAAKAAPSKAAVAKVEKVLVQAKKAKIAAAPRQSPRQNKGKAPKRLIAQ